MNIRIDLSNFTGPMNDLIYNCKQIPKECAREYALYIWRWMAYVAPYETGLLISTIEVVEETGRFLIYPWVEYAKYPRYYGRIKGVIYPDTYAERSLMMSESMQNDIVQARAIEILSGGL